MPSMKKLLFPLILHCILFLNFSNAQDLESLESSLDSIKNAKTASLEKVEELSKLEIEYLDLIDKVKRVNEVGKYFKIRTDTYLYKLASYSDPILQIKAGSLVKLINNDDQVYYVEYRGQKGYVISVDLKEAEMGGEELSVVPQELSLAPVSNGQGEIIKHTYYSLMYDEANEQADWVFYKLTSYMLGGNASRTDNFREDPFVTTGSAALADYKGTGYDRGHLCPAGDMVTDLVAMSESFYLSNMSPQVPAFNRGIWKILEGMVRNWAVNEKEIYVATGPVFKDNLGSIGSHVTIPGYYYKVVYDPTGDQKMIAFVLPNAKGEKQLPEYIVSVDYVENLTGIDFFSGLPDDVENKLEANSNKSLWEFQMDTASSSEGESTQCLGTAKSTGQRCRNHTTNENGYCYLHQDQAPGGEVNVTERLTTSVQCSGTTQKGARCKNKTLNANGYCYLHQSQVGAASQSVTGTKSTSTKSSYSGGRVVYTGPRGGKYYINKNGNKIYIKK